MTSRGAGVARVLVVGGGIAGMAAALALRRRGVAVTLIDADPEWRVYGAGISLTGLSLRAFDDLGVLDEIRARGAVHAGMRMRHADGSALGPPRPPAAPDAPPVALGGGILRPVLHEILSRRVRDAGVEIRLGVRVASLRQDADGVEVVASDGTVSRHDLVVGADGIRSALRGLLFSGAPEPTATGQGCWRIVAPRPPELAGAEIYFGGAVKLGLAPVSATQIYLFVLEATPPERPRPALPEQLAHLDRLLAPFGGQVPAARASLGEASQIVYRPLEWLLLPAPWHRGRVVLIGDAAHATTPHLASGAGLAVEDALVLADELETATEIEPALSRFMARRFERVRQIVEASRRMGESELRDGHRPHGPDAMAAIARLSQQPY